MAATKKFKITIEQIKKDIHSMELDDESAMGALDQAREMVKLRNERSKASGNVFSVKKVEEIKDE